MLGKDLRSSDVDQVLYKMRCFTTSFTKWDVLPQVQNGNDVFIMWGIYEKCMKPQIKVNVLLLIKMEEFDFL